VAPDPTTDPAGSVLWTAGYYTVEPVLVYNSDGYKPGSWRDLHGETVAYLDGTGLEADIAALGAAHPAIRFHGLDLPSPAGLFAQVSDGTISYAIVGSLAAAIARHVYLDYEVAFTAGPKRDLGWIVAPRFRELQQELDRFLARMKRNGTLARAADRYVPDVSTFQRIDAAALRDSIRTVLPRWRPMFHDAQERTDVEWRLLAAIAYQESKWDPYAMSETGVRGFMQITEDTAKHLGITDLLDAGQNVRGAARYLRDLKAKLPERIPEPDRTWLALAAFNIGLGHLEDARVLAQRQKLNPDLWSDVRKALPLLALPEYHTDEKNGYARGGMPVAFVDRVRSYYDVLLAQEPALQPRLRMPADGAPAPAPDAELAVARVQPVRAMTSSPER
jgi:peptidoglycan lytic transglycosylase F